MLRVATDIGGTFTDLVYVTPGGEVGTAKSHTTPAQFEKGVMDVIEASQVTPKEFVSFVHGTTIVINAITERKGAKVGLLTTQGFRDILEIGRGNRPDFFNLEYRKPKPFVPRYLRREMPERITYKGIESKPLDLSGLPSILDDFRADGVEAIAICFINSYANPAHEEAVLARVKELWPEVSVVASHQITREWREYERTNTAVLSAYVQPIAHRYLDRLTGRLLEAGMRCTPIHHAIQLRGGYRQERAPDPDHDDRIRPGQRDLGSGGAGPPDRRAGRDRDRYWRNDRQVRADHEWRSQAQHQLPGRAHRDLCRIPGDGAGGGPGGDRQRWRVDCLGG